MGDLVFDIVKEVVAEQTKGPTEYVKEYDRYGQSDIILMHDARYLTNFAVLMKIGVRTL